jgi:xylose isomerase
MRTYLALAEKARRFREDPEIRGALESAGAPALAEPTVGTYSRATADALLATRFDPDALVERGYHNDRLDQSVVELILGLR